MQGKSQTTLFFDPSPNTFYKILSVMNGSKCLTIDHGPISKVKLDDYKAKDNQKFTIIKNKGHYAIVNGNSALHILNQSSEQGAIISLDSGQYQSSFFEIVPVTEGQWAGKACYFRTFYGKTFDISGGNCISGAEVKQYHFHGGPNQIWVITHADSPQKHQEYNAQQGIALGGVSVPDPASFMKKFMKWEKHGEETHEVEQLKMNVWKDSPFKPNQSYAIFSEGNNNKCVQVLTSGDHPKAVCINDWQDKLNQKFYFEFENDKYRILSAETGNYLCVYCDNNGSGHWIMCEPLSGKQSQWWKIHPKNNNFYHIKSFVNKGIDVPNGNYNNQTILVHWDFHGGSNQSWIIRET